MKTRECNYPACYQPHGNCPHPGSDGLPVQCVGPWVLEKYHFLKNILEATLSVRRQFFSRDNSVFVDLFSGPGKCIIRNTPTELNSICMDINMGDYQFNTSVLIDINDNNITALETRLRNQDKRIIIPGDTNEIIPNIVNDLLKKKWRYHFAYIDPFGCENLNFLTIKELAKLDRMDLFINFPIGSILRNINEWIKKDYDTPLDLFLGTKQWRDMILKIPQDQIYESLSNIFKDQLSSIGYPLDRFNVVPVKNTKKVTLYVLFYAAKHHIGQKIWDSVLKIRFGGQKELF
jgi:three-Cys-motif partner protein